MNDYFPELDGNQSVDYGKMGRRMYKGGGGGGTQTTTQNIDPQILPYILTGLEKAEQQLDAGAPAYYPGQTYVDPSSQTTSALGLAEARATSGNPLIPAAQTQALGTVQGDYLSAGNPYLSGMMASAAKPAVSEFNNAIRNIGSRSAQSGRYGSGAMGEMESQASENLANSLTNRASELAFNNYNSERARQEAASINAPTMAQADYADINQLASVGKMQEGYGQTALDADMARYNYNANAPTQQLSNYLAAAYGAPAPINQSSVSTGGGK